MGKKRRHVAPARPISGLVPIAGATLVLAALIGFAWQSGVLPVAVTSLFSNRRMARYADAPRAVQHDLLYLTYLDSLWRDELAVPDTVAANVARAVVARAGVPPQVAVRWGLAPEGLNELYERAAELGRLRRPDHRGLLRLIRDREVRPGYVILGQRYPYTHDGVIDFCAILTRASIVTGGSSKVLYWDDGRMVHGKLEDVPRMAYFGSVVPGDDLERVYDQYLMVAR